MKTLGMVAFLLILSLDPQQQGQSKSSQIPLLNGAMMGLNWTVKKFKSNGASLICSFETSPSISQNLR